MACNTGNPPYANWTSLGLQVNFDGSNICVSVFCSAVDGMGNNFIIDKTYPVGTPDIEIAEDLRTEFLNAVDPSVAEMHKRCIQIREILISSLAD